uniref:Reverse transcriptase domain-containing protein n=1 Tax=Anolis carolinensis TaxID=28377 RepID=A0A803TVZ8_ANOCA
MNDFNQSIKVFSNNINGLNAPTKRKRVYNYLKKNNFDVIALQEVHIKQSHAEYLINDNLGKLYHSLDREKKKKGVALYINNKLNPSLEFKDNEGRIVAAKIESNSETILICNIYAPNGPKRKFVKNLRNHIRDSDFNHIIIMGDFNGILEKNRDKKAYKKTITNNMLPQNFIDLKNEYDLHDSWRLRNPTQLDYTFYSSRHNSWSRIDMIWVSKLLTTKINKVEILARDLSDHGAMLMEVNKKKINLKWRLNDDLIKREEDIVKIRQMTKEYFKFNNIQESDPLIIWDAYKAVARGFFIQQKKLKTRRRKENLKRLQIQIEQKEKALKANPGNNKINQQLTILRNQKKNLELDNLANQIKWAKQYSFENANKPGKWLARILRKKRYSQQVLKINSQGRTVYTDEEIKEEFKKYYEHLYEKEGISQEEIVKYLCKQKLQKITDEQRLDLNKAITPEEVKEAIKETEANKAPGLDGFIAGFYKIEQEEVIAHLVQIMNLVLTESIIPKTWSEAEIIMIHKEGKDQSDVKNYRPIALLNTDYKLFTKIMAKRLSKFLNNWIADDQSGFLPNRSTKDNIRIIIDAIEYYEYNHQKTVGFLALDAEKAFDQLNWDFIKLLLRELDMGAQFQNTINAIYTQQEATIRVNGQTSGKFNINRGARQGCPLSPLIFILTLEILLRSIREDSKLVGIKVDSQEIKVRAFADDVICIIENPRDNIRIWLNKIEEFGKLAGFKINKDKSVMLTKNLTPLDLETIKEETGLQFANKIKYLGIWIATKNNRLLELNYVRKWKEIKKDLEEWKNLKISLLGRIATVKMSVLPKMLYLFRNIPIIRNNQIFNNWNKDIRKFVWNNKRPRIKLSTMLTPKERGGLDLPDLKLYHEACALDWIRDWANLKKAKNLSLEGYNLRRGWHGYLWYGKHKIERNFGNHFVRSALLKTWIKYKRFFYEKTPLWLSPLEAYQRRELGWISWPTYKEVLNWSNRNGLPEIKKLEEIQIKYKNISWLHYYQLRDCFRADKKQGFSPSDEFWDIILHREKKVLTILYNKLVEWSTEKEVIKESMLKWSRDINRPILINEWEAIWNKKIKYCRATDLKENWIKMIHRWYLTPKKIALMYSNIDNKCWRCKEHVGSYFHMWWSCKKVKKFWSIINVKSRKILKINLECKPEYYL